MCYSYPQILYVDGDLDSREILKLMLQQADENYEITVVEMAEDAVELISKRSFDLYIFDQPWRTQSGIDLCRFVREKDAKTPILVFSVMSRDGDREKAMRAGATAYLIKADDTDRLVQQVQQLLKFPAPRREPANQ
jgi:DNA-binding response OmpR family regulator